MWSVCKCVCLYECVFQVRAVYVGLCLNVSLCMYVVHVCLSECFGCACVCFV